MPKVRKLKRKKRFRVNVNRKRLRNKLNKLPTIACPQIKAAWEGKQSIAKNLESMGLAYDPNRALKIPNVKDDMLKFVKENGEEVESDAEMASKHAIPEKLHVQKSLEEEARHPRIKQFRLPNNEVHFATYMMDKYDQDYKAMARDRKNYYQLTWRQIKSKIDRLKSVPEQYAEYLVKKGEIVLEDPEPLKKMKPPPALVPQSERTEGSKKSRNRRKRSKVEENEDKEESGWQEESILEEEEVSVVDDGKRLADEDGEEKSKVGDGEKKLQLFPDEKDEDVGEGSDDVEATKSRKPRARRMSKAATTTTTAIKKNKTKKLRLR